MTRSRYGMLAGVASAALAAWWWRRRGRSRGYLTPVHDRGATIFHNAPQPSGEGVL